MGAVYREANTIGSTRSSSLSAANGVWSIHEAENRNRNSIWPVQIVTSSLVWNADPAIIESYSGTGNQWFDLTSNGQRFSTLANSPTYSTANGGYFVFNGTTHVASSSSLILATNNFSFDIWAKPTGTITVNTQATTGAPGTTGQRYIIDPIFYASPNAGAGISLGTNGISVYEHSGSYLPPLLSHGVTISSTVFTHFVVVYTNKQPSLYINNTFIKTGLTSPRTNVYCDQSRFGGGPYGYFAGQIAAIKIYDKSLNASEVNQNFNAFRNRYGI